MWAVMPMLRSLLMSNIFSIKYSLPREMGEGLIGLSHLMCVLPLCVCRTLLPTPIQQFVSQSPVHGTTFFGLCRLNDPPHGQRHLPLSGHFYGYLIRSAADAPGTNLYQWLHVIYGRLENLYRPFVLGLLAYVIHGGIKHPLRRALFPFPHQAVYKLSRQFAVVSYVRLKKDLCASVFKRH